MPLNVDSGLVCGTKIYVYKETYNLPDYEWQKLTVNKLCQFKVN